MDTLAEAHFSPFPSPLFLYPSVRARRKNRLQNTGSEPLHRGPQKKKGGALHVLTEIKPRNAILLSFGLYPTGQDAQSTRQSLPSLPSFLSLGGASCMTARWGLKVRRIFPWCVSSFAVVSRRGSLSVVGRPTGALAMLV